MNVFKILYYRITLSRLAKRQLNYLYNQFEEWHKSNCPELSSEEALENYSGIPLEQLLNEIRE